ncbi:L-alanine exporter AlaE [Jannaschia donghaensis]|uniref:L-alanine exporter AlaE n=1 Tax=Jannaschia donghaensis TaxID=420998 RepID=A0A0M6YI47_9RHOB|nr:L-alanine exporter AlaE [Jannaschia donghaensis]
MFFTLVAGATELLIVGMTPGQVLATRAVTIPVMVLTGRPYGRWRDAVLTRVAGSGPVARTLADVGAFLTFQVPVYGAILMLADATTGQVAAALTSATFFMVILARPFGLFLDAARRIAARY